MSQIAAMPNKGTAEKATDCNWKKVFVRSKILEKKEKTGKNWESCKFDEYTFKHRLWLQWDGIKNQINTLT